ncbi:hypothetical protein Tco_0693358 [Tanacetum coccineum]
MVNVFPPDHVDDLPEVEPNQPNLAPAILEPALVDENEEPEEEEEEFEDEEEFVDEEEFEEEEPQEEEDMEVDIGEEENEPELTFPYVEADPLNLPPPASDSKSDMWLRLRTWLSPRMRLFLIVSIRDINSLFGWIASLIRRVCGREMAHTLVEKKGKSKDKYYCKLIDDLGNEVRCSVGEREAVLEDLIKEFGNAEEKVECKKLKKELEDARIMPPKSRPLTPSAIERMITSRINEALTADRARRANVSGAGGSRQGGAPAARECTFVGFMKCNPTIFHGIEGAVKL